MNCPSCDEKTYTQQSGVHVALFCHKCGFIKFIPQPWQNFVMPIGKYKGKTLLEIKAVDKGYLQWAVDNMSGKSIVARIKESQADNQTGVVTNG